MPNNILKKCWNHHRQEKGEVFYDLDLGKGSIF
jgi:hypothetical protein